MKLGIKTLGVGVLALLLTPPAAADTIKVAALQPQSGDCANWGVPITRGVELWAEEFNNSGGIRDATGEKHKIEVIGYDNACYTAGEELKAARRAILDDGVEFLLQTYTPAARKAIAPLVTENKALTLSYGSGFLSPDYPYLIGAVTGAPSAFMLVASRVLETHPEIERVAIVTPDHSYGLSAKAYFRAGVAPHTDRVDIVYDASYDPGKADDMFGLASPIAAAEPDLILELGMSPGPQALFVETMEQLGYDGLYASGGWTRSLLEERVSPEYIDGRMFSAYVVDASVSGIDPRLTDFYERYVEKFGAEEWTSWASVGFATMTTLEAGIKAADEPTGEAVRAALFSDKTVEQPLFGTSTWAGSDIYGANTHLLTPLPINVMKRESSTVHSVVNTTEWWRENKDAALPELEAGGQVPVAE